MKKYYVLSLVAWLFFSCKVNEKQNLIEKIETTKQEVSNSIELNDSAAMRMLGYLNEFTKKYPKDSLAASYWFESASMYRYLHQPHPALEIYKKLYNEYPQFTKHADCLFLQGMVLSNEMNQKEAGKKIYQEFVQKYPDHFLAPQVQILIEQMNMTDAELIESFKKKDTAQTIN